MVLGCQMLAVAGLSQALGVEPSQAGSLIQQQQQQQQRLCSIFIHSDTVLQWRALSLSFYLYFFLPLSLSLSLSLSLINACFGLQTVLNLIIPEAYENA